VHPKYQTKPAFGWVRKGSNPAVKTTSGRGRVNIHGALRLENFDAPFVEPVSVDGNSAVQLLAKIEARNPTKSTLHVIWDNAPIIGAIPSKNGSHARIAAYICSSCPPTAHT